MKVPYFMFSPCKVLILIMTLEKKALKIIVFLLYLSHHWIYCLTLTPNLCNIKISLLEKLNIVTFLVVKEELRLN